jgi:hypothetical protein
VFKPVFTTTQIAEPLYPNVPNLYVLDFSAFLGLKVAPTQASQVFLG